MKTLSLKLQEAIERFNLIPKELPPDAQYVVGRTYWCNYWERWYRVLCVKFSGKNLDSVTVEWQDGSITTHCTNLRPGEDLELQWAE